MKRPIDMVFDIETDVAMHPAVYEMIVAGIKPAGNLRDPEKIAADVAKKKAAVLEEAALSPSTARIVSIAAAFVRFDHEGELEFRQDWAMTIGDVEADLDEAEGHLLRAFVAAISSMRSETSRFRIVTYNGRRFDVPFAVARMIAGDVDGHRMLTNDRRVHLDLVDVLPGGLARWGILLDQPKTASGSSVRGMVESGDWDALRSYNANDVDLTVELWRRASRAVAW